MKDDMNNSQLGDEQNNPIDNEQSPENIMPEMQTSEHIEQEDSEQKEQKEIVNEESVPETTDQKDSTESVDKRKKHKSLKTFLKVIAIAAVLGLLSGGVYIGIDYGIYKSNQKTSDEDTNKKDENVSEDAGQATIKDEKELTGVAQIVDNIKPSIVAITSTMNEVSYDLFGRPSVSQASGAGSGIIIGQNEDELLISTNNHVINGANNIVIQFIDETTATGQVKGTEVSSDLAVVAVDMKDLSNSTLDKIRVATLGNSDECKQGELVIAIGNALGYGQSTTVGYVSALDREVTVDGVTLSLLQTDAAINPGNSGGAILNAKGEVIGISSVKYVKEAVEGIGYAIPISSAIPIINDLMNREVLRDFEKSFLGISGEEVTESYSKLMNFPIGIYINKVESGSPADEAGLKVGNILTGINDRKIETLSELQNFLNYTKSGTTVTLQVSVSVKGEYTEKDIEVTLGSR